MGRQSRMKRERRKQKKNEAVKRNPVWMKRAALTGIAALTIGIGAYLFGERDYAENLPLERYGDVVNVKDAKSSARTLHIVFQRHMAGEHILPKSVRGMQVLEEEKAAAEVQKNVYRILEKLYKDRGVRLYTVEGYGTRDLIRGLGPIDRVKVRRDSRRIISDDGLRSFIKERSMMVPSAMIGIFNPDAKVYGWEDEKLHAEAGEFLERFAAESDAKGYAGDDIKLDRMFEEFDEKYEKPRSLACIRNSIALVDSLYEIGQIPAKEAAAVVGAGMMGFVGDMVQRPEIYGLERDARFVLYIPKGIKYKTSVVKAP